MVSEHESSVKMAGRAGQAVKVVVQLESEMGAERKDGVAHVEPNGFSPPAEYSTMSTSTTVNIVK